MTFPSPSSLLRLLLSVRKTFPDISSCTPVCARVRKRKERCKDDAFGVDAGRIASGSRPFGRGWRRIGEREGRRGAGVVFVHAYMYSPFHRFLSI